MIFPKLIFAQIYSKFLIVSKVFDKSILVELLLPGVVQVGGPPWV